MPKSGGDTGRQPDGTTDSFVTYLQQHKVSGLMEGMLRDLAEHRPPDPSEFLRGRLAHPAPAPRAAPPPPPGGAQHEGLRRLSLAAAADRYDSRRESTVAADADRARAPFRRSGPDPPPAGHAGGEARAATAASKRATLRATLKSAQESVVLARLGPVVGKVAADSAIVLLEVDTSCEVTCAAVPADGYFTRTKEAGAAEVDVASMLAEASRMRERGPASQSPEQRPERSPTDASSPSPRRTPRGTAARGLRSPDGRRGSEGGRSSRSAAADATASDTQHMTAHRPTAFRLDGLRPDTKYRVQFHGLAPEQEALWAGAGGCTFRTQRRDLSGPGRLRVIALSCDRPNRLMADEGETNPWDSVAEDCASGDCDLVVHIGDQVYTCMNDHLEWCYRYWELMEHSQNDLMRAKLATMAVDRLRDAYRDTWGFPGVRRALAHASHLMLWSDNDVANDFTVLKDPTDPSQQAYPPGLLRCAMDVYREYQRQLWDPAPGALADPVEEWHFHMYGRVGVFMTDMRGSRISAGGVQLEGPILTDRQRDALRAAFREPGLSCMLVCSEIPYVGDDPSVIRQKAERFVFLEDHWPYHEQELRLVLDLCFDWRAEGEGREVVLLGGDIHVGVESVIRDRRTGLEIKSITTSPITNHVCGFFPALAGSVGDRYTYEHKVLPKKRNYCAMDITWDGQGRCKVQCDLVSFHTISSLEEEKRKEGSNEAPRHKGTTLCRQPTDVAAVRAATDPAPGLGAGAETRPPPSTAQLDATLDKPEGFLSPGGTRHWFRSDTWAKCAVGGCHAPALDTPAMSLNRASPHSIAGNPGDTPPPTETGDAR